MKLPRPNIPISVRCHVALRQIGYGTEAADDWIEHHRTLPGGLSLHICGLLADLALLLGCPTSGLRLDHNPALALRHYNPRIKNIAARYRPHANDPASLWYIPADDHDTKTFKRGLGAQRSDVAQIKKERRRERRKKKPKNKRKWASRPFPKIKRKIPQRKNPWGKR